MYSFLLAAMFAQTTVAPVAPGASGQGCYGGGVGTAPPTQALARIDAKGTLILTVVNAQPPQVQELTYTVNVKVGDVEKQEARSAKVTFRHANINVTEVPANVVKAYGTDGKEIAADRLAAALEKDRQVLVSADGQKVDPFHLKLIKDDTIVLVTPTGCGPAYGHYGYGQPQAMPVPVTEDDGEGARPAPPAAAPRPATAPTPRAAPVPVPLPPEKAPDPKSKALPKESPKKAAPKNKPADDV